MNTSINSLFEANKNWVNQKNETNPAFFDNLSQGQQPQYLWLGCADSRVSPNLITGTDAGDIFVHRNIANMAISNDLNFLAVLQYAVQVLKVPNVVVCGHYGCGGIKASLGDPLEGPIGSWVGYIREVYQKYAGEIDKIQEEKEKVDRLVELNVTEQVKNIAKTPMVKEAWEERDLTIHGLVFDLYNGNLKDLEVAVNGPGQLAG